MIFQDSQEIIELIEQKKRNGIQLKNFKRFMDTLDNPQNKIKSIHVAGTNGKGSTTNNIRSILQQASYRVGSFTSPYLETHHDRIRINDVYIDDKDIVAYANKYYDEWIAYDLSMFEIDMFIATMYFVDQKVDYAIFEVGLGGEKDATNIITPMVSVITNIGKDHMEYLGTSYEEIATAKAGIVKEGVALITSEKRKQCLGIFEDICKNKHAQLIQMSEISNIEVHGELSFTYKGIAYHQQSLALYQAQNACLAIETVLYLRQQGFVDVTDQHIQEGIYLSIWKGRFEVLQKKPLIIVDGAHNEEGIKALVDSLQDYDNINILFSALKDKPYHKMLDLLGSVSSNLYVCEFPFYRSEKASELAKHQGVICIEDYKEALAFLRNKQEPFVVCGSLYFISMVRDYILKGASTL